MPLHRGTGDAEAAGESDAGLGPPQAGDSGASEADVDLAWTHDHKGASRQHSGTQVQRSLGGGETVLATVTHWHSVENRRGPHAVSEPGGAKQTTRSIPAQHVGREAGPWG